MLISISCLCTYVAHFLHSVHFWMIFNFTENSPAPSSPSISYDCSLFAATVGCAQNYSKNNCSLNAKAVSQSSFYSLYSPHVNRNSQRHALITYALLPHQLYSVNRGVSRHAIQLPPHKSLPLRRDGEAGSEFFPGGLGLSLVSAHRLGHMYIVRTAT